MTTGLPHPESLHIRRLRRMVVAEPDSAARELFSLRLQRAALIQAGERLAGFVRDRACELDDYADLTEWDAAKEAAHGC